MAMRPDTVAVGSQCHVALLDPRCCDVVSVVEGQKAREVSRPPCANGSPSSRCVCWIARHLSTPFLLGWGAKQSLLLGMLCIWQPAASDAHCRYMRLL